MEDNLWRQLKKEVAGDLEPIRPLPAPSLRALWWLAAAVVLGAFSLTVFEPRQDMQVLGGWKSVGYSALQGLLCLMLLGIGLRNSIPGRSGSRLSAGFWLVFALVVQLTLNWSTLQSSSLSPAAGREWATGLACLTAITALSLLPLAVAGFLLSRGLLTYLFQTVVLTGVGAGLLAEATWRLHCGYSSWGHILPFHAGALVFPVLIAIVAAILLLRRH